MRSVDGFTAREGSAQASVLSTEAFGQRAREILGTIEQLRGELGLNEAIGVVIERYVDEEPHAELRRFGEVVARSRQQALVQQRLDDDREQLHHGQLDHEGLVTVGHHYETLRHAACVYNHLLRGLVESCGQYFSRDELMGWMTSASQGRAQWAKGEVTGAVSEIALHAALQGIPEIRELRYASVDEDLAGYDFVGEWRGETLTIDAKTGLYAPLSERKHGHKHIEISVPREAVKDFRLTRHGLDLLRREVRQALYRDDTSHHVQHRFYRRVLV